MPQADTDKLKAFVQKMHDQGAAGFAAGPWSIDETASRGRPAPPHRPARQRTRHHRDPAPNRGERVLGMVAMLSIATIVVGITGIYLSEEPGQPVATAADTPSVATLTRQLDGSQLSEIRQKLRLTNNRLDSLVAEFRRLQRRTGHVTAVDERRLQDLEERLVRTVTRLDRLSTEIVDLKHINNAILAATLNTAPPAASPVETRVPASYRMQGVAAAQAGAAGLRTEIPDRPADETQAAAETPVGTPADDPDSSLAALPAPEPVAENMDSTDTVTGSLPVATPQAEPAQQAVATAGPEPATSPVAKAPDKTSPASDPAPGAAIPAEPAPKTVALATPVPDTAETKPAPARRTTGDWVINIASYRNPDTADRHVAELQRAGIGAERVEASIKGGIMYRVRVGDFASRSAARSRAGELKQELDLPGIWIAKR